MANRLDRAVWMFVQRAELWQPLGHDAHELFSEQAAPYGEFFAWLDRLLNEQGVLAPAALMAEMVSEQAVTSLGTLAERIAQFHSVEVGSLAPQELAAILDGLRLQAVTEELAMLAETQGLSDEAGQRQKALYGQQSELKKRLSHPPTEQV
jgi:DNA primase